MQNKESASITFETLFASFFDQKIAFDFYGVDNNAFCIGYNGSKIVFEATEDPNDGYRSYLDTIQVVQDNANKMVFFETPIAQVYITIAKDRPDKWNVFNGKVEFSGYALIDAKTNHTWLLVGTDYADDYYPSFTFSYQPYQGDKDDK